MNKKEVKDFRIKLLENDMTIKVFVQRYNLDYVMFNQAINGIRPVRQEYQEAIRKFMEG